MNDIGQRHVLSQDAAPLQLAGAVTRPSEINRKKNPHTRHRTARRLYDLEKIGCAVGRHNYYSTEPQNGECIRWLSRATVFFFPGAGAEMDHPNLAQDLSLIA